MKPREIPIEILMLEAILRRISTIHPKRPKIEEDLRRRYAGHRGEESIDYHLTFLVNNNYMFLHNLRLPRKENTYFQIDSLILSPSYIILLEVKNMAGTLLFDEPVQQLIRITKDGKEESFTYPITQVNRHVSQLNIWLRHHKFPNIPIIPYVVISNSSTIIKTNSKDNDFYEKVSHAVNLPDKINQLQELFPNKLLTSKKQKKLAGQLKSAHTPSSPDMLNWFDIRREEIKKGLYCEACNIPSIIRIGGSWKCTHCNSVSKDAHIRGLVDYYLLIDHTITNQQFRSFFNIESRSIVSKLLLNLNLETVGSYKDRKYILSLADFGR